MIRTVQARTVAVLLVAVVLSPTWAAAAPAANSGSPSRPGFSVDQILQPLLGFWNRLIGVRVDNGCSSDPLGSSNCLTPPPSSGNPATPANGASSDPLG
jgi:hypothetical protein